MENFDFKELIKSPYMYVGLGVGFGICYLMNNKKGYGRR